MNSTLSHRILDIAYDKIFRDQHEHVLHSRDHDVACPTLPQTAGKPGHHCAHAGMSLTPHPHPQSFLHLISLRTATEFITLALLVNKVTGLYGILAIFTGYELNPLQLSHYIYSLVVLVLVTWLAPAIKKTDQPLKNVALAWVYVLDSVINSVYTALFGAGWFLVLAQNLNTTIPVGGDVLKSPGAGTIEDTSGFTNPKYNATQVDVVAQPGPGLLDGQKAVAYHSESGSLGHVIFQSGSIASLTVLGMLWIIRVYFCIIIMSHARSVLRQYIASTSTTYSQQDDATLAENPFRVEREEGAGWKGKLGRLMLRFPTKRYWLGRDESQDEWTRATSGKFESGRGNGLRIKVPEAGLGERERRARSGTGPPPPIAVKGKE